MYVCIHTCMYLVVQSYCFCHIVSQFPLATTYSVWLIESVSLSVFQCLSASLSVFLFWRRCEKSVASDSWNFPLRRLYNIQPASHSSAHMTAASKLSKGRVLVVVAVLLFFHFFFCFVRFQSSQGSDKTSYTQLWQRNMYFTVFRLIFTEKGEAAPRKKCFFCASIYSANSIESASFICYFKHFFPPK